MASVEKDSTSKFDKLPVVVQAILGVLSLALITAVGFGVYFLFDVLLLDLDPIGSLFRAIF
ncbi:MAG TPA: hypothetical protein DCF70_04020 [Treponema sp.]|nr:hypothetical protein [Treponema sp.]HAC31772.1 hypothetical protein [Treponema sp.]